MESPRNDGREPAPSGIDPSDTRLYGHRRGYHYQQQQQQSLHQPYNPPYHDARTPPQHPSQTSPRHSRPSGRSGGGYGMAKPSASQLYQQHRHPTMPAGRDSQPTPLGYRSDAYPHEGGYHYGQPQGQSPTAPSQSSPQYQHRASAHAYSSSGHERCETDTDGIENNWHDAGGSGNVNRTNIAANTDGTPRASTETSRGPGSTDQYQQIHQANHRSPPQRYEQGQHRPQPPCQPDPVLAQGKSQLPIKSVVTTSFSMDEERDCRGVNGDTAHNEQREGTRYESGPAPRQYNSQGHYHRHLQRQEVTGDLPPIREHMTEVNDMRPAPHPVRVPASPRLPHERERPALYRTRSSSSAYSLPTPMKRSFWHHSRPDDEYQPGIPSEFIPPKRTKPNSPSTAGSHKRPSERQDFMQTSRSASHDEFGNEGYPSHGGSSLQPSSSSLPPPHTHPYHYPHPRSMSSDSGMEHSPYAYGHNRRPTADSWDWYHRSPPSYRESNYVSWPESPSVSSPSRRFVSPEGGSNGSGTSWNNSRSNSWSAPSPGDGYWNRRMDDPRAMWHDARDDTEVRRQDTFDAEERSYQYPHYHRSMYPTMHYRRGYGMGYGGSPGGPGMPPDDGRPVPPPYGHHSATQHSGHQPPSPTRPAVGKTGTVTLLAMPDDRISLSETLCIVRENVEVFTATAQDVEAPAPGRKYAVQIGQVGLRCVHCRHTKKSSDRVKRAVCYPSSIKRIYRTVIDMKLDHFSQCKFVPAELKDKLNALKQNNTRSTGTTMQYFIRAATNMGMVDGSVGVRMKSADEDRNSSSDGGPAGREDPAGGTSGDGRSGAENSGGNATIAGADQSQQTDGNATITNTAVGSTNQAHSTADAPIPTQTSTKSEHRGNEVLSRAMSKPSDMRRSRSGSVSSTGTHSHGSAGAETDAVMPKEVFIGKVSLSAPDDEKSLSPLRCFLRKQVCAFSATEEDIAVRTPTTFPVTLGQVGIGCVHCLKVPPRNRQNRSVCFPFSIARIYQSVADIQRFHLNECQMIPAEAKARFVELQEASSKGSKGLATRQYWITSAKKMGMIDTPQGIRFGRDPDEPEAMPFSLDILAQVASDVKTTNRPLVLPEDKPYIAQFLYVVMEQLQPCRFTEADRNKRRLKDVGCIGVECKHCAGKVDGRKFFWSSVSAVESNFVSVHTHMMECAAIPDDFKKELARLKSLRKEQTSKLKVGSQKAFFTRVWNRLHEESTTVPNQSKSSSKHLSASSTTPAKVESTSDVEMSLATVPTATKQHDEGLQSVSVSATAEANLKTEQTTSPDVEMRTSPTVPAATEQHDGGLQSVPASVSATVEGNLKTEQTTLPDVEMRTSSSTLSIDAEEGAPMPDTELAAGEAEMHHAPVSASSPLVGRDRTPALGDVSEVGTDGPEYAVV